MASLSLIQWLQIIDAFAWAIPFIMLTPAVVRVCRGQGSEIDWMAPPIVLIAFNRIWSSTAWLIYPEFEMVPTQMLLWVLVRLFSILSVAVVIITYQYATKGGPR